MTEEAEIYEAQNPEDSSEDERIKALIDKGLREIVVIPSKDVSQRIVVKAHEYRVKQEVPLGFIIEYREDEDNELILEVVFTLHPGEWTAIGYAEYLV